MRWLDFGRCAGMIAVSLAVAACAPINGAGSASASASAKPPYTAPSEPGRARTAAPMTGHNAAGGAATASVVTALLEQARQAEQAGHGRRSEAALERALRVAPRDALIWYRMAELRLRHGHPAQAQALARKSIDLAPDNAALRRRGRRLIAAARTARAELARDNALPTRARAAEAAQ